ncbi:MAG: guanylate kinase [Lachnospirales bacterium]
MNKGILIIISGPSGSGKGTIVKLLDKEKYALSISMTTREPRKGEVHGKDYFFVSKEKFVELRKNKEFLEHVEFCGNMYGTPRSYVRDKVNEGKFVILEIDVFGALQIKELYPNSVLVFVVPPSMEELRKRLTGRGTEDEQTIERRLRRASDEIEVVDKYDYIIINDEVERCKDIIDAITVAEKCKPKRNETIIEDFKGENLC